MLGALIVTLMSAAIFFGIRNGTLSEVSAAAIGSCSKAVELTITLAGSMALWGGVMQVAEKSGITAFCERMIAPVTKLLFKDMDKNPAAKKAVSMNIAANLFGLGNAATPLGISAAKQLQDPRSEKSKRNIAMLVVLNTASIQLIPTTIGAIRLAHGAQNPFDITLPVLFSSVISAAAGCVMTHALYVIEVKKHERK